MNDPSRCSSGALRRLQTSCWRAGSVEWTGVGAALAGSLSNENGDHVAAELVNFSFVQKLSDDPAATHHPNVSARLRAQSLRERLDRLVTSPHPPVLNILW